MPLRDRIDSAAVGTLLIYLQLVATATAVAVTYDPDRKQLFLAVAVAASLFPFLLVGAAASRGSFAYRFRLARFALMRRINFQAVANILLLCLLLLTISLAVGSWPASLDQARTAVNLLLLDLVAIFLLAPLALGALPLRRAPLLALRGPEEQPVFVFENGGLRACPDWITLNSLGVTHDHIVSVGPGEFAAYPKRPPLVSIKKARIVCTTRGDAYVIFGDVKRLVPDEPTLEWLLTIGRSEAELVSQQELAVWQGAGPIRSVLSNP